MINDEEDILRYINHSMSDEERTRLEERLAKEEGLREELEHSRLIHAIVDQETSTFANEVRDVIQAKKGSRFNLMWVAASICIILTVGIIMLWPSGSVEDLGTQFMEPYPDVITNRSTENIINMDPYNQGNYQQAIEVFEPLADEDLRVVLYLGVSYLMLDKNEEALKVLNEAQSNNSQFEADFTWYIGLAALKSGEKEQAIAAFEQLKKNSNYYRKRASEILENLD